MDKLNTELIKAKKRLDELDLQGKTYTNDNEYKYLQDKIHLYFDSTCDTTEAEKFIISSFWQKAYEKYADGGYITDDLSIRKVRYPYELYKIDKIISSHVKRFNAALELGCGNGKTCEFLAKRFKSVVGADLSKSQIEQNKKNNSYENINYTCKNAFEMDKKYDFVFASDMFMYSPDKGVKQMFEKLLSLLRGGQRLACA